MINIQLKAKHYYLAAETLFGVSAYESFATIEKIKAGCQGVADEDLVTISIEADRILFVYKMLTYKPEGQFNQINSEMGALLLAQIQTGVAANDPEWISLGEQINSIRLANLAVTDSLVQSGKSRLYGI